jgi:hypothetical protein
MLSLNNNAFLPLLLAVLGLGVITHAVPVHLDTRGGLANPLELTSNQAIDDVLKTFSTDVGRGAASSLQVSL